MKCKHCGFEREENFEYCVNCGAKVEEDNFVPVEPVSLNPTADLVMPALKDNLFLALCILMSASSICTIATGGMPLIYILVSVFMWLAYADAKKGFVNEKHIQGISGTIYASYVIVNVLSVIIIAIGALFGVFYATLQNDAEFMAGLALQFQDLGIALSEIPQAIIDMFGWILCGIMVFVGVIALLFNVLMTRTYHRFVKSVYKGVMFQNPNFKKATAARNWLVVFAVCSVISLVSSITAAEPFLMVSSACQTAIGIIASKIINKHFV